MYQNLPDSPESLVGIIDFLFFRICLNIVENRSPLKSYFSADIIANNITDDIEYASCYLISHSSRHDLIHVVI